MKGLFWETTMNNCLGTNHINGITIEVMCAAKHHPKHHPLLRMLLQPSVPTRCTTMEAFRITCSRRHQAR